MAETFLDPAKIRGYHAHIYYAADTKPVAAKIREAIESGFQVTMGRWHDEPVGPHPISMYQVAFEVAELPRLMPWLMLNRGRLDVLVHPETDDSYDDHTLHAAWLGTPQKLRLDILKRSGQR